MCALGLRLMLHQASMAVWWQEGMPEHLLILQTAARDQC